MMRTILAVLMVAGLCVTAPPPDARAAVVLDRIVAVVNQEAITWIELYQNMEFELSQEAGKLSAEEKQKFFKENEEAFLETMIDMRVQLQEAEKRRVFVADEEVEGAIGRIREKLGMDEAAFQSAMIASGMTLEKYRETIRNQIIIRRLVDWEVRKKIRLSDDDIQRLLREENLEDDIVYGLRHIFFRLPEGQPMDSVSDRVALVSAKLARGEDFADVAREYSEGPAAKRGGDLGLVPKSQLAPEFIETLEDLRPGESSQPARSAQGVHIFQLTERVDAREVLRERVLEREHAKWLKNLRGNAFIEIRLD
jgi:peptidyl-prolyl cis-trans isomerase SurA